MRRRSWQQRRLGDADRSKHRRRGGTCGEDRPGQLLQPAMHDARMNAVLPGKPGHRLARVQPIPNQLAFLVRRPATAQDQRAAGLASNRRDVLRNGVSEFSYSRLRLVEA